MNLLLRILYEYLRNNILLGCLGAVTMFALFKVITKAGFDGRWILMPLVSGLLNVIVLVWQAINATRTVVVAVDLPRVVIGHVTVSAGGWRAAFGPLDPKAFDAIYLALWASIFINWALFLVFAFREWPISLTTREVKILERREGLASIVPITSRSAPAPEPAEDDDRPDLVYASIATPSAAAAAAASRHPSAGPPPAPVAPKSPVDPGPTTFCEKCGESITAAGAFFHECPPDRPQGQFCTSCGTPKTPGATKCAQCGAAN